jgi:TPR repeat protein
MFKPLEESAMRSVFCVLLLLPATLAVAEAVKPFDPAAYSQVVTDCDRLASHPEDPHRVLPGLSRPDIDLPAAIAACEAAVQADPKNPRLNYQLARVYGYSGVGEKAIPYRAVAVDADYPQALFVVGYLHLLGLNKQPQDLCRAGELIRRAAQQDRLAGQVGFVRWALQGQFDGCEVPRDRAEMLGFLAAARKNAGSDFYQTQLIELLEEQVQARMP